MAGSHFLFCALAGVAGLVSIAPHVDRAVDAGSVAEAQGFAIPRARDGQFYVDGRVDGVAVRFMIDPDADAVMLAGSDAARIGAAPRVVEVGPRRVAGLPVRVSPGLPVSILGRPFLAVGGSVVSRDRLILR